MGIAEPLSVVEPVGTELNELNTRLERLDARERIEWALAHLPANHVLSSSFGIQAAVTLHLVTEVAPDIPVILVDTGYLFPETYRFIAEMTERLDLNLQVYTPDLSPAWQEAMWGRLWEGGREGLEKYNQFNKVEPMRRALDELGAETWFAGLRRSQAESRSRLPVIRKQHGRFKLHPIVDWHNRDVHRYLRRNGLPYHPLWEQGYVSVGDRHSTRPLAAGMREEDTRFFGLKRECGLHE